MTRPISVPPLSRAPLPEFLAALRAALDGSGPALGFGFDPGVSGASSSFEESGGAGESAGGGSHDDGGSQFVPADVALVVATSGSTGSPRRVMLDSAALLASAHATQVRLGGPGQWLLTLPTAHVAGLQVLVRSIVAGTSPVVLSPGPFRPESFLAALAQMTTAAGERRYVSLVPTQLHRLLTDATPVGHAAREALTSFDAILVGGAALGTELARAAEDAGLAIVRTYGMTETCGGCVYDGTPLEGVVVRTDEDGHIMITGPTLARGYLGDAEATAAAFPTDPDGIRWHRTTDLGTVTGGRVRVTGRADDVIITGGVNVAAGAVEAVLAGWHGIGEACVVGVPHPEWGQAVIAVVTAAPGTTQPSMPSLRDARAHVSAALGAAAAPRALRVVEVLPLRGPGKVDRRAVYESCVTYTSSTPDTTSALPG